MTSNRSAHKKNNLENAAGHFFPFTPDEEAASPLLADSNNESGSPLNCEFRDVVISTPSEDSSSDDSSHSRTDTPESDQSVRFLSSKSATNNILKSAPISTQKASSAHRFKQPTQPTNSLTINLPSPINFGPASNVTVTITDDTGTKHSYTAPKSSFTSHSKPSSASIFRSGSTTPSYSFRAPISAFQPAPPRKPREEDQGTEMTPTPSSARFLSEESLYCSSSSIGSAYDEDEDVFHLSDDEDQHTHNADGPNATPSVNLVEIEADEEGDIFFECEDYDPAIYEPSFSPIIDADDLESGPQAIYYTQPGFRQRLYDNTIGYIRELKTYTYNQPKDAATDFAKWLAAAVVGLVATAPAAINALAAPSGKSAKEISRKWFEEMSTSIQALSITNAFFSTYVNLPLNKYFVVNAWGRFKNSIKQIFNGPRQFFDNTLAILFGIGGGIAAGSIALNSFAFLPLWVAAGAAGIGFVLTATSRYLGSKKAFSRFYNAFFNSDAKTQRALLDAINHLQPQMEADLQDASNAKAIRLLKRHYVAEHLLNQYCAEQGKQKSDLTKEDKETLAEQLKDTLHNTIHNSRRLLKHANLKRATSLINQHINHNWKEKEPFTPKDFELLYKNLAHALNRLEARYQQAIFNQKTTAESIASYAGAIVDVIAAISLVAAPTWLIFMQKGYDGINSIAKLATHQTTTDLDKLNIWEKRALGVIPAFASSLLYGIWTSDFRSVLMDTFSRLKANPSQIPMAALWLIANGFAASSMTYVGKGVVNSPTNLLGDFFQTDEMKILLPILLGAGGFFVNYTPNANSDNVLPLADTRQPTIAEITSRLRDPNTYYISEHSAGSIQKQLIKLSFFSEMKEKLARKAAQEQESRDAGNTEPSHIPY